MPKAEKEESMLAVLLDQAREESERFRETQGRARTACVRAVRKLEETLREALGGEKLRGLPVLYEDTNVQFYGARARGKKIDGTIGEKAILVIDGDGSLRMVKVARVIADIDRAQMKAEVVTSLVEDAELLVEDVEDVARAVEEVLRRHLAYIAKRSERYTRLATLAARLESICW
jgi:hypothetical protein